MAPGRVHRRKIMIDTGNRFASMTLKASDPGSDGMMVAVLLRVAILTLLQFKDFYSIVRIGQKCPPSSVCSCSRRQIEVSPARFWPSHQRHIEEGSDIDLFKITGAYLPLPEDALPGIILGVGR
jgi:hypothetical protein